MPAIEAHRAPLTAHRSPLAALRPCARPAGSEILAVEALPYLVFYVERGDSIDVWRVLHGKRDVPARIREPDTG